MLKVDGSSVIGTAYTDKLGRFRSIAPTSGPVLVGAMHHVKAKSALTEARVEARWTELVVADSSITLRLRVIEATPAADGRFVLCGVPRGSRVAMRMGKRRTRK